MNTSDKCNTPGCRNMATNIVDTPTGQFVQFCPKCFYNKYTKPNKDPKIQITTHKMKKIIETYLDLAQAVQDAGGSVSLIKDKIDKPLSEFLEDVCSTNNIRFKHDNKGKYDNK